MVVDKIIFWSKFDKKKQDKKHSNIRLIELFKTSDLKEDCIKKHLDSFDKGTTNMTFVAKGKF